ncbi:hypothetical protein [Sinorhizobium fredii]|uniref:Ribbon-helix-helix protein CopG domain-containing protein n=1 Tax=Rhizobium fredii TaxID=380 RepID=A0A2L0HAT2_RHIFR|nr:hypothetical protein [Sinorhizobium fredii]AUX78593.1 hypothetical protein NXT3_PA00305 [Sinorhizobium fredii]
MMIFDDDVEAALALASEELQMTREELMRVLVRECLESYAYLPLNDDEGSETAGGA